LLFRVPCGAFAGVQFWHICVLAETGSEKQLVKLSSSLISKQHRRG